MPPQLQALLQNRNALIAAGGGVLLVLVIIIFVVFSNMNKGEPKGGGPLDPTQRGLATVESLGKAIEIQALLAREGIRLDKEDADGGKIALRFGTEATKEDRDRALITMVQSGLMDKNVGLEAFDKGDLTASREEKKIKLVRAQQGELARLIRKIPPIEEATVSLAIPEQTIFKSDQKPMSASVQVTLPNGEMLDRNKVRSIINLVVGSIQGLDAPHVALADTNGNTYNSVLEGGAEINSQLQEQDQYMKQKVAAQLDKLVGPGNYVVTVSTLLRQAAKETMTQQYDPAQSVISSKQSFSEKLNSPNGNKPGASGPASTMLPSAYTGKTINSMLPPTAMEGFSRNTTVTPATPKTPAIVVNGMVPGSMDPNGTAMTSETQGQTSSGRGYTRTGTELGYATGKTQTVETDLPGMIEDISVAVSVDRSHFPASMTLDDLKGLVAHAANPKINPADVTIVKTDFQHPQSVGGDNPSGDKAGVNGMNLMGSGNTGNGNSSNTVNWSLLGAGAAILLSLTMVFLSLMGGKSDGQDKRQIEQTRMDLEQLRQFTVQQQNVIEQSKAQAQQLLEAQQQLQQIAGSGQNIGMLPLTEGMDPNLQIPAERMPQPAMANTQTRSAQDAPEQRAQAVPNNTQQAAANNQPLASNNAADSAANRLGETLSQIQSTLQQADQEAGLGEEELSLPIRNWLKST